MKKIIYLSLALVWVLVFFRVRTEASSIQFLGVPVGARSSALGGAYSSVGGDIETIFFNPAGLTRISGQEISFVHNQWLCGINYEYFGYAKNISNFGSFATAVKYLYTDAIPKYTLQRDRMGTFTSSDLSIDFACARKIKSPVPVSLGFNVKYFKEKIESFEAQTILWDLGACAEFSENISGGMSLQNIGYGMKFIEETEEIPVNLKIGAAFSNGSIICSAEANLSQDFSPYLSLGAEYLYSKVLGLRVGYKFDPDLDSIARVSAGFGLKWRSCKIDYAFLPFGELGYTNQISVSWNLPANVSESVAKNNVHPQTELAEELIKTFAEDNYSQSELTEALDKKIKQEADNSTLALIEGKTSAEVSLAGTPGVEIKQESSKTTITLTEEAIHFLFDSAEIQPVDYTLLNKISALIKNGKEKNPDIEISGYTDDVGTEEYNEKLSCARALNVRNYLAVYTGLSEENFTVYGRGMDKPIAPNATESGRAFNRRVEICVAVAELYSKK